MRLALRIGIRTVVTFTIASGLGLLATMIATTPDKLGPFGITLWFVGLTCTIGGGLTLLIYYPGRVFNRRKSANIMFADALRWGMLAGTWLTALLALNSLRQLGVKDIVLVSLLIGLIEFYMRRVQ